MTAESQFNVEPGQILGHAGTVGRVAGELSSAGGGMPAALAEDSLGSFLSFVTQGLGESMALITQAVGHSSSTMDGLSSALVHTAEDYQRADEDNSAMLWREVQ